MLRFSGFELDRQRAELRGADGVAIKLRPKTITMLILFATRSGRVLSKQELMDAVWPNVHVGDDSLFQCIRELRTALGDDRRQIIKLVQGRGYLFDAEVTQMPVAPASATVQHDPDQPSTPALPTPPVRRIGRRAVWALAAAAVLVMGLALVTAMVAPGLVTGRGPITLAVMPITAAESDLAAMARDVTTRLGDGLAKIDNVHVATPQVAAQDARTIKADFVVSGELLKRDGAWELRARMTRTATGNIVWTVPVSLAIDDSDVLLQQSRLAAGVGHPLALRINALLHAEQKPASDQSTSGSAGVVIEQAMASITQTSQERFAASQTMLDKALTDDPGNVDLAIALAALQLRGVQMVWYSAADSAAAERKARAILERGLKLKPDYLPVLEAYCRFLNATNEFVESLVACARTLSFDPWNGVALYHIGLTQLQLGRFEEALVMFKQADRFDTPRVSRWTWQLGAGMSYLFMGRAEDALPWLQSSIAITPASGRPYMLLSAAYQQLGRHDEAKAAMDKALALRPGSNLNNIAPPPKNANTAFLAALGTIGRANVAAGLPER
ncbi:winged helix-turn-helix domain-containing protein [Tardiphaga robiniae]|uniref:Transcriptional regulator CadC n=1 Tax=Tardiphaga robiniae TaxID=943830 RepID=A0A163XD87_9BRAD|nr:winged helix-turn-helix domain-containing protein [Tardiphaga robiniae]KZD20757.1 transcriptional regulator CadC [Tardiphaga robiniae]